MKKPMTQPRRTKQVSVEDEIDYMQLCARIDEQLLQFKEYIRLKVCDESEKIYAFSNLSKKTIQNADEDESDL